MRRKLGEMEIPSHAGWKKPRGPLPPTRSVFFVDNTAGGELAWRLQEAEKEAGVVTGYRVRITEAYCYRALNSGAHRTVIGYRLCNLQSE